jgi:hypothetical protein
MLPFLLWTAVRDWMGPEIVFDSSFEAVCLFSSLGLILSLVFLR